jgi:3-methyladenine DNA glycosylase AlkD
MSSAPARDRAAIASLAAQIERDLRRLGDPDQARGAQAYLKHELVHLGVATPALRGTIRALPRDLTRAQVIGLARALWPRGVHELRMAAIELLMRHRTLLGLRELPLLERMVRESGSWAYVDAIAAWVVGDVALRHPRSGATLDRWARDPDFWLRRAAMLALLVPLRRGAGDLARFERYADAMLDETEFFIRKAIGWVLREIGKRRPDAVFAWLAPRAARASGVTLREALKPLTAAQRKAIAAARARPAAPRR